MKKTLQLKKLQKRIDRITSLPFTVKASRAVDQLLLKIMEAGNE